MLHKSNSKKSAPVAVMYGSILVNTVISDLKYLRAPPYLVSRSVRRTSSVSVLLCTLLYVSVCARVNEWLRV